MRNLAVARSNWQVKIWKVGGSSRWVAGLVVEFSVFHFIACFVIIVLPDVLNKVGMSYY